MFIDQDFIDSLIDVDLAHQSFVFQELRNDLSEVDLFLLVDEFVDEERAGLQPLPDEGFEAGEYVHEVEAVFDMDEDVVEVEATHIAHTLEELFDVLRQLLFFLVGFNVELELFLVP